MLEKQKEPSTSEPMSTTLLSNQLAKEATLQNTVGNTTMTLIGITREYWILKRIGKPGESRKQFIQKKINTTSMGYHSNYPPSRSQYYRKTKKRKTSSKIRLPKTHRHQTRVRIRPQCKPTNQQ